MAVVKMNFIKRGRDAKKRAKATVRYIQHRPGKDGERIIRTLFGSDGVMERTDAYRMIDETRNGDILFRIVISPDKAKEDLKRDLNMREITSRTMLKIEEIVGKTVLWTAAEHAEHTDIRHVHALAVVPGRLYPAHFNLLIREATNACFEQRRELDLIHQQRELERSEREEAEWGRGL